MPIFGKIILKVNVARFARTFSSLLSAGVSVIEALNTTAGALTNVVVQKSLYDAAQAIKNGQPVSESLATSNTLPPIVIQMAAVGEETGQLDTVLTKVADFYEEEVDTVIASLSSIIEPILIVGLGAIVGFIVMSVLGPITALQGAV
jgi:type IV pilus assembly protein PilC